MLWALLSFLLMMIGFLYGQTEYSLLENVIHLDDYIEAGKKNGYSFLSITDNNLYGHYKFYKKCLSNDIIPLIGLKLALNSSLEGKNYVLLYALNQTGYRNLLYLESFSKNNIIVDDKTIKLHKEGLALISAAMDSDFEKLISLQRYADAKLELQRLESLTDDFYVGIMPKSFLFDLICDDEMAIIKQDNLKYLPLAKTCYLTKDDCYAYDALLKINDIKASMGLDDFHFRTKEELSKEFIGYEMAFSYLEEFIAKIEKNIIPNAYKMPKFPSNLNISSGEYLKLLTQKGLEKRLKAKASINYQERLDYELKIIDKMGYNDYFLIVWDFIKYAKTHDIMVGPGRGSAAGSLVAYSLGITEVDPIKYGLLFERFLNPERVSMPDIDTDFEDLKRDEVIKYVRDKYGKNHVCYISAFGTFQLKSSIRDLFRVFGYEQKYIEPMIKFLQIERSEEEINQEFSNHQELINLIKIAKKIEGLPRHISTHAAGIIIANEDLFTSIPLSIGLNGLYQSELEASDLEELGMLKIDFLGIRNLTLLKQMVFEIKKYFPSFELKNIPLDDPKTLKLFSSGETLGIFQFESRGMVNTLKEVNPSSFEDIVAILALYRPGPLEQIPTFAQNKRQKKIVYLHPDLEPILASTYGVIVYQEQIMQIAKKFAGYSLGEADLLRRAVSKKKRDVLEAMRLNFINGAIKSGYSVEISNKIYNYIVKFASYGFNRNHAVAYAILAFQIAYIKAHFFKIFMAKMLDSSLSNDSETVGYINYLRRHKVMLLPFDINSASINYGVKKEGLVLPLGLIKGLGSNLSNAIIEERKKGLFKDYDDFYNRLKGKLNSSQILSLIDAGAFDFLGVSHADLYEKQVATLYRVSKNEELSGLPEFSFEILSEKEKAAFGFNLKYDMFGRFAEFFVKYKATMPSELVVGKTVNVIGVINNLRTVQTKNKQNMAFISLNSQYEYLDVVCFADTFEKYNSVFSFKGLVLFNGIVRTRKDNIQLNLIKAKLLA